jgi:hypothetical protein
VVDIFQRPPRFLTIVINIIGKLITLLLGGDKDGKYKGYRDNSGDNITIILIFLADLATIDLLNLGHLDL